VRGRLRSSTTPATGAVRTNALWGLNRRREVLRTWGDRGTASEIPSGLGRREPRRVTAGSSRSSGPTVPARRPSLGAHIDIERLAVLETSDRATLAAVPVSDISPNYRQGDQYEAPRHRDPPRLTSGPSQYKHAGISEGGSYSPSTTKLGYDQGVYAERARCRRTWPCLTQR
jgi:hypothetical protein